MMPEKSDAEKARDHAYSAPDVARTYAALALANSIHAAALGLSAALIEAARIRAGKRS